MAKSTYKCPSCNIVLLFEKTSNDQLINCPKCGNRHRASEFHPIEMRKAFCPACNVGVQVSSEHSGVLTCPKCKTTNHIDAFSKEAKDPEATTIEQPSREIKTQTGRLKLIEGSCTPAQITLAMGINLIGRKPLYAGQPTPATILLDSADSYMSKKHANIDVILRPNQTFEYRLSDAGSSNGTWHNGTKLDREDIVLLQPGDKVRIGHTTFEFVI